MENQQDKKMENTSSPQQQDEIKDQHQGGEVKDHQDEESSSCQTSSSSGNEAEASCSSSSPSSSPSPHYHYLSAAEAMPMIPGMMQNGVRNIPLYMEYLRYKKWEMTTTSTSDSDSSSSEDDDDDEEAAQEPRRIPAVLGRPNTAEEMRPGYLRWLTRTPYPPFVITETKIRNPALVRYIPQGIRDTVSRDLIACLTTDQQSRRSRVVRLILDAAVEWRLLDSDEDNLDIFIDVFISLGLIDLRARLVYASFVILYYQLCVFYVRHFLLILWSM